MTKMSLIIPVYNRSELLIKSLVSLAGQSLLPDELIITDDGSDEDIPSKIKNIISSFPFRIMYIKQKHKGFRLAKARNNGIRNAESETIVFCDQDLIYTKDYLKTFIEHIRYGNFVVAYPIRLNEEQSNRVDEMKIKNYSFADIITVTQKQKIKSQYRKDKFYYYLNEFNLRKFGVKLRGGCVCIKKSDLIKINGYDEQYIGWGNEDDDLYKRLFLSGVKGINPFIKDYPLHLYHEPFHVNSERVNKQYYNEKASMYTNKFFKCEFGIDNPYGEKEYEITQLV
jgi:hypothetical protein